MKRLESVFNQTQRVAFRTSEKGIESRCRTHAGTLAPVFMLKYGPTRVQVQLHIMSRRMQMFGNPSHRIVLEVMPIQYLDEKCCRNPVLSKAVEHEA